MGISWGRRLSGSVNHSDSVCVWRAEEFMSVNRLVRRNGREDFFNRRRPRFADREARVKPNVRA
jgi:hypothetical protein